METFRPLTMPALKVKETKLSKTVMIIENFIFKIFHQNYCKTVITIELSRDLKGGKNKW